MVNLIKLKITQSSTTYGIRHATKEFLTFVQLYAQGYCSAKFR